MRWIVYLVKALKELANQSISMLPPPFAYRVLSWCPFFLCVVDILSLSSSQSFDFFVVDGFDPHLCHNHHHQHKKKFSTNKIQCLIASDEFWKYLFFDKRFLVEWIFYLVLPAASFPVCPLLPLLHINPRKCWKWLCLSNTEQVPIWLGQFTIVGSGGGGIT